MVDSDDNRLNDFRALGLEPVHESSYYGTYQMVVWNELLKVKGIHQRRPPDPAKNEVESATYPRHVIRNPLKVNGRVYNWYGNAQLRRDIFGNLRIHGPQWHALGLSEEEEKMLIDYIVKYMGTKA